MAAWVGLALVCGAVLSAVFVVAMTLGWLIELVLGGCVASGAAMIVPLLEADSEVIDLAYCRVAALSGMLGKTLPVIFGLAIDVA